MECVDFIVAILFLSTLIFVIKAYWGALFNNMQTSMSVLRMYY